ncbi:hypothetical protein J3R30DRAFT_3285643 [Lentinula aciculospora]|uniref:Regulatory protein ral2 n=1 Tax=Lentinula aciculospora TaxID=153920 RepID=A0A9W9AG87_9AGAR|nr:hypothetical protein J3R30DRAFT_3285643 [Lentinula aciculospora]
MLHSIYDLTTSCRKTTGDVPAKLVGASTTVVGSKVYLFGGRLVTERRMVSDLYTFDLKTCVWEKVTPFPEDEIPKPRYFHSSDTWNNQLIIFGGMSSEPNSPNPDELCVLSDVRFFDLNTRHWIPQSQFPVSLPNSLMPRARYAHLSSVTADRLFIIGGQDFYNTWLDDICVYDLLGKTWVQQRDYPRHCGTYRSVAVSSSLCVRLPQEEVRASQTLTNLGPPGTRFRNNAAANSADYTSSESLTHIPYSATPTDDHPANIHLYSNYNFTDVKRELEVFSPLPDSDFTIQERSSAMNGTTFPPGLRFPTGAILGTHLIIAGTYLAHSYQSFSIWVLDLLTMTWSRIDPGKAVETGSWFRGCVWPEQNKFFIFGNRSGNLVDDYNRRLLSWDHVAVIDLEAFGIYQPPPLKMDIPMQELGLAALEERVLADFEILCDDGRKIACSRRLLEERWPWFNRQRKEFCEKARKTSESLPTSPMHVEVSELPGVAPNYERPDPRLTPRALHLSEPYPITLALLQYFYTLSLTTPLQLAPAVLSQLLVLATNYRISHLEALVKHAMHRALSNSTSVGVYEVATLCGCRSLQIRALKTVMSYTQKRPRREKDASGRPPDGGSGGGGGASSGGPSRGFDGSGGSRGERYSTRPRGTSDAKWKTTGAEGAGTSFAYNVDVLDASTSFLPLRADSPPLPTASPSSAEDDEGLDSLFTRPRHLHTRQTSVMSVVSLRTAREMHDVVELLGSTIDVPIDQPRHERAKSDETILDPYIHSPVSDDESDADKHQSSILSSSQLRVSYASSYSQPSEFELVAADGEIERVYLPLSPSFPGFHIPQYRASAVSETPSLTSSRSRSSYSSTSSHQLPSTPGIITPAEYSDGPPLPVIVEKQSEGQEWSSNSSSEEISALRISPPNSLVNSWPKQKSKLQWKVSKSPRRDTITEEPRQPASPGPLSPSFSDTLSPVSPNSPRTPSPLSPTSPPTKTSPFSLFTKREKGSRSSVSSSISSQVSQLPLDNKTMKAEEKRLKKEEAKARTERLAQQLKTRAKERARAEADNNSTISIERRKKEPGAMYGGIAGVVM